MEEHKGRLGKPCWKWKSTGTTWKRWNKERLSWWWILQKPLRKYGSWAMHYGFAQRILRVLCGNFEQRIVLLRRLCGGSAAASQPSLPNARSSKMYPQLKLKVFVDDIQIHFGRKNREVLQTVPKVVRKLTRLLKLSLTKNLRLMRC